MTLGEAHSLVKGEEVIHRNHSHYVVATPGVWLNHHEPFYNYHLLQGLAPGLLCYDRDEAKLYHTPTIYWLRLKYCKHENPYRDLDIGSDEGC